MLGVIDKDNLFGICDISAQRQPCIVQCSTSSMTESERKNLQSGGLGQYQFDV